MNTSLRGSLGIILKALRDGQRICVEITIGRLRNRETHTALVLPTRYGKSDVIRCIAVQSQLDGIADYFVVLSPNRTLRAQMASKKKWKKAASRYSFPPDMLPYEVDFVPEINADYSDMRFMSATIQSVQVNVTQWCIWVKYITRKTGRPVVFFVDETHMAGQKTTWGKALNELVQCGALLVLLTATAIREDGDSIDGFEIIESDVAEYLRRQRTQSDQPGKENVDLYLCNKKRRVLKAHHTTTFQQAWNENPSPLCKLSRIKIDPDVVVGGVTKKLSEIENEDQSRRFLAKAIREDRVIVPGVASTVEQLDHYKSIDQRAQAIVFCGNDTEGDESNAHALQIKRAFRDLRPDLRVFIVTSADDEKSGKAILSRFAGNWDEDPAEVIEPHGDVLIVKQMAGIGVDLPWTKVALDLSPVRAVASYIQRMMRAATPCGSLIVATILTIADRSGDYLWDQLTQGIGESSFTISQLIRRIQTEKQEGKERTSEHVSIGDASVAGSDDSVGNQADREWTEQALILMNAFPSTIGTHTTAEVATRLRGIGAKLNKPAPVAPYVAEATSRDPSDREGLRAELRAKSFELRSALYGSYPSEESERGSQMDDVWNRVKRRADIWVAPKKASPGDLMKLIATMEKLIFEASMADDLNGAS